MFYKPVDIHELHSTYISSMKIWVLQENSMFLFVSYYSSLVSSELRGIIDRIVTT